MNGDKLNSHDIPVSDSKAIAAWEIGKKWGNLFMMERRLKINMKTLLYYSEALLFLNTTYDTYFFIKKRFDLWSKSESSFPTSDLLSLEFV